MSLSEIIPVYITAIATAGALATACITLYLVQKSSKKRRANAKRCLRDEINKWRTSFEEVKPSLLKLCEMHSSNIKISQFILTYSFNKKLNSNFSYYEGHQDVIIDYFPDDDSESMKILSDYISFAKIFNKEFELLYETLNIHEDDTIESFCTNFFRYVKVEAKYNEKGYDFCQYINERIEVLEEKYTETSKLFGE